MNYKFLYKYCLPIVFIGTGCKKLIEVDPPYTSYTQANVYSSDATAIAVLTGIYANMASAYGQTFNTGVRSISIYTGLSGDEFTLYAGLSRTTYNAYYTNALSVNGAVTAGSEYWAELYNKIFICNEAVEGLSNATALTPVVRQQLTGEAKFLRAFFYFYLLNLFGDIPLVTATDFKINATLARTPKDKVYQQLIIDLKDAITLLSPDYLDGSLNLYPASPERVRPSQWAAMALLARVYLYMGDFANAEIQASKVIDNTALFNLNSLNDVFLKNSNEAIWQLQPVNEGRNTEEAFTYIIPITGPGSNHPVYCSSWLLNSFEPGDQRKANWINNIALGTDTLYYPYKYKSAIYGAPVTEYLMVLRLAELYLIRAEARAQQKKSNEALSDLNLIRRRAGLSDYTVAPQDRILAAILHERQVELFTEWGHRWLDLKRTGKVNEVMQIATPLKGGIWSSYWQWYPIPVVDIQRDPNITQNQGY